MIMRVALQRRDNAIRIVDVGEDIRSARAGHGGAHCGT
jgi:hypothetical protein